MTRRPGTTASRRAAALGVAGALTLSALLGACGDTADDTGDVDGTGAVTDTTSDPTSDPVDPTGSTDATEATEATDPTEPTEPTETVGPTETVETVGPTDDVEPAPADLTPALLPAARVAGLNEQWRWRQGSDTTDEPPQGALADCVRFSLAAIGAQQVAIRTFVPPASAAGAEATATQVVAQFGDTETATRVMSVLRAWKNTCERRLNGRPGPRHRVSESTPIAAGDDAFAYLTWSRGARPDTTAFEDVGQVRRGRVITLVVVRLDEMDYNYRPRRTPAARTLPAAAAAASALP